MFQGPLLTTKICIISTTRTIQKEFERLQEQQILMPAGVDETAEYCNSFVVVLKLDGTV